MSIHVFDHFKITYFNNVNMAHSFNPNINAFDGDSQLVNFFFTQVAEIAKFNKWDDAKTIFFLKTKLVGPALNFFLQSDCSSPGQTFEKIKAAFTDYFSNDSPQASILDLTAFHILPDENIKSLSHRLNILIHKVYTNVDDKKSLDQIKKTHLLQVLPTTIRLKIMEEKLNTYDEIVTRAQELQAIHSTVVTQPSSSHLNKFDELSKQINFLSDKLSHCDVSKSENNSNVEQNKFSRQHNSRSQQIRNNFKQRSPQNKVRPHFYHNSYNRHSSFKRPSVRYQAQQDSRSYRFYHKKQNPLPTCAFCGKRHLMAKCWQFLKLIKKNEQQSALNPQASIFKPNLNGQ